MKDGNILLPMIDLVAVFHCLPFCCWPLRLATGIRTDSRHRLIDHDKQDHRHQRYQRSAIDIRDSAPVIEPLDALSAFPDRKAFPG
jgi:hypothetical protein